jgi:hypothetical protein
MGEMGMLRQRSAQFSARQDEDTVHQDVALMFLNGSEYRFIFVHEVSSFIRVTDCNF